MKKLAIALSGGTLAVGIMAALLWRQLDAERGQLTDLQARVAELESTQPAALSSAAPQVAAATAASGPDTPAPAPAPALPPSPEPASSANVENRLRQGLAKGVAEVLSSPEGSDMIRSQVRAVLAQQYPDLAAELRLTPAEAERFLDLLARQTSGMAGDALGLLGGGNSEAARESQRRVVEKQLATEKEISRMLGSKYPAWQEYQGTATARQQVSQLRSLLGSGADALTETQSKPLIAALGSEQARINKEEQNRMSTAAANAQPINLIEDQLKNMPAHNERLVSTASSHLNSSQLERYKGMLTQQEKLVRAIMGSMNAQGNTAGQSGAPR